jgi:hypothetical protein
MTFTKSSSLRLMCCIGPEVGFELLQLIAGHGGCSKAAVDVPGAGLSPDLPAARHYKRFLRTTMADASNPSLS